MALEECKTRKDWMFVLLCILSTFFNVVLVACSWRAKRMSCKDQHPCAQVFLLATQLDESTLGVWIKYQYLAYLIGLMIIELQVIYKEDATQADPD